MRNLRRTMASQTPTGAPPLPAFDGHGSAPPALGSPGFPAPAPLGYAQVARPPSPPELPEAISDRDRAPGWAPWTAPLAFVAGFAVAIVGAIILSVIAGLAGGDLSDPPPVVTIVGTIIQGAALIGAAILFARLGGRGRPTGWDFGLRRVRFWPALGWTLLTWITFMAFSIVWALAMQIEDRDELPTELGADESTIAMLAVALLVTVWAPIAEELFFRGYFFTALRNWKGVWPAAVITGLVFGGIHFGSAEPVFLVPLAVLGFGLCVLYWWTQSLLPCMALHALNNSIAFGVGMGWAFWQVLLTIFVSNAIILVVMSSFLRGGQRLRPQPVRAPARA